jgi:hypothetical protein
METRTTKNTVKGLLAAAALCLTALGARGQTATPKFTDTFADIRNNYSTGGQQLAYVDASGKPTQPGTPFSEILRGNGTRAGYVLSHGGVIPGTVTVTAGARSLRPNVDYYLDFANGSLFFTDPVRSFDTISVHYSYVQGQDAARNPAGVPGMALSLRGMSLNFGMGVSSVNGLDFTSYGLSLSSSFGKGSTLNGLLYFSTPNGNQNNLVGDPNTSLTGPGRKANSEQAKSDHLIVQNLNLKSGAATFRATYQDIGLNFNGFQAMRQQNANNADVMAQLGALEKEKGIRRLGFGSSLALSKTSNFNLDWDKISDSTGDIVRQGFGYQSGAFNFKYNQQTISDTFTRFQSLREGDAAQWARERGIKRSDLTLGFATGRDGTFNFSRNSIADKNGDLSGQSFDYTSKAFNFALSSTKADPKFARLNDLSDADKTALALNMRRQYNPNATAAEVTPQDKAQIALNTGLNRDRMAFSTTLGKMGAFAFNQFSVGDASGGIKGQSFSFSGKTFGFSLSSRKVDQGFGRVTGLSDSERITLALDIRRQFNPNATVAEVTPKDIQQMGAEAGLKRDRMAFNTALGKQGALAYNQFSIADDKGGISRRTLNLTGRNFAFNYLDQNIAAGFERLGSMSEFERAQFANEIGIHRTGLGLNLSLSKASSFAFSRLSLSDSAGGMTRQSFAYNARGLDLHVNLGSTDKTFARARDLAGMNDAEKNAIEAERGYKRMDFSANVTAFKGLTLQTYVYDANNAADNLGKGAFRHFLGWQAGKTAHISFLTEGNSFSQTGRLTDGRTHNLLTFDTMLGRGMKFNTYHDTVETIAGGEAQPTVTTDFLHLETDRSRPNNWMAETKRVDFGNGHFENTDQFDLNYRASKTMGLHLNRLSVDRGSDPSATTNTIQWNWQMNKALNFQGLYAQTDTNNQSDMTVKGFTLSGQLTKNLSIAGSYNEINQKGKNVKAVSDISFSNVKPINFLGMKDTIFTFKYAALNDQHRQQTEQVSGKIQGMLGKNQVALEYGGALDPKNNCNIQRAITFVSDRNEKLPLHFDFAYKAVNVNRSALMLERRYNFDLRLDKLTKATYTYSSLPFNMVNNQSQPITTSAFALTRTLSKTMNLAVNYSTNRNLAQKTNFSKLMALINGHVDRLSTVEVGYSVDLGTLNGQNNNAHTLRMGFNHNLDADHFLAVSTSYTMYQGTQPDAIAANVDFKTRF